MRLTDYKPGIKVCSNSEPLNGRGHTFGITEGDVWRQGPRYYCKVREGRQVFDRCLARLRVVGVESDC